MDLVISSGLLFLLALTCYQFMAPFLGLLVWSVILAIVFYPLHQWMASRLGQRQGMSATLLVVLALALVGVPAALLSSSLADSVMWLIEGVHNNTLKVPAPPARIAALPLVGDRLHDAWLLASTDLPALVHEMQPKIGDLARAGLAFVAGLGSGILLFLFSFVIAAVLMAFGAGGARTAEVLATRVSGAQRGPRFVRLATSTVRAVALGVVGVAAVQALLIGCILLLFGVPGAGLVTVVALVLGIAQLPMALVTLPFIAWVWLAGDYQTTSAVVLTVALLAAGLSDNILKPLMFGRGVDAPMPVILLGALGGMMHSGIRGLFVGAVVLAIGHQLLTSWIEEAAVVSSDPPA